MVPTPRNLIKTSICSSQQPEQMDPANSLHLCTLSFRTKSSQVANLKFVV